MNTDANNINKILPNNPAVCFLKKDDYIATELGFQEQKISLVLKNQ